MATDTKLPAGPYRQASDAPAVIADRTGQTVACACGPHDEAFAARIVACVNFLGGISIDEERARICVNACQGIPDSVLTGAGSVAPAATVTGLQTERDALRAQVAELRGHHTETEAILAAELVAQKAQVAELATALQRADDLIGRTIFYCDPPVTFTAEAQDVIRAALAKVDTP